MSSHASDRGYDIPATACVGLVCTAAAGLVGHGQIDIFVSDLVPHKEGELVDEVVLPLLQAEPRRLRTGALIVLTFKGTKSRNFSEAVSQDVLLLCP